MWMAWWLKRMYMRDNRADRAYWEKLDWVSDRPGRVYPRRKGRSLPREGDVRPPWAPKYEIGDILVIALVGDYTGRCPAIVRVEREPRWEPSFVDQYGSASDEGDRWGVVTNVSKVAVLYPDQGPTLDEVAVGVASTRQRGYIKLSLHQYELAEQLIAGGPSHIPGRDEARAEFVPIEGMHVEGYDLALSGSMRRATRNEQKLVLDYCSHLRHSNNPPADESIGRFKILVSGGANFIYCDLFNSDRNQLIEAKADCSRNSIRVAIGQLADYAHHLDAEPQRAVLLPKLPEKDLCVLLKKQGIAIVWREGDGFADDADGTLT
jgi:hypothetical protein